MTKKDWLLLFIKILGLYVVVVQLGTFITTLSSLIIVLSKNPDFHALPSQVWQIPLSSGLVIIFGIFLACKSDTVAEMIGSGESER